uniref:EamA domain-containing protein n=1 Tax=Thermosporothrix sp. COM3 TaxID=2490863 RepID=A0A455ST87_9CHLR|nr:hypothetical protein KTC_50500 [Thermosporothrix sp. COM3]
MSIFAVALVLFSALCHASWNLLTKKVKSDTAFLWLFSVVSLVIYLPPMAVSLIFQPPVISAMLLLCILVSAILHSGYYQFLQIGYRKGDLSLIYPLARGTGPLLSMLAAILLLHERPGWLSLLGALLIISGVFILVGNPIALLRQGIQTRTAILFALLTGTFIASYTLWDKYAVSVVMIAPLFYDWSISLLRSLFLAPVALRKWHTVQELWQHHRKEVFGVALLSPLAYILVLVAMSFTPLTYVAPLREVSILFGTFLGTRVLSEAGGIRRILAALVIVAGVVSLVLS